MTILIPGVEQFDVEALVTRISRCSMAVAAVRSWAQSFRRNIRVEKVTAVHKRSIARLVEGLRRNNVSISSSVSSPRTDSESSTRLAT
jgi:hypothetical protein